MFIHAGSNTRIAMSSNKVLPSIKSNKEAEEVTGKVLPPVHCKKVPCRKTLPPINPACCKKATSLLNEALDKDISNEEGSENQSTSVIQSIQEDGGKNKQKKIRVVPKPRTIIRVAEAPITERVPYQDTPKMESMPTNFPARPSTAVLQFLLSHTATSRECQKIQNLSETKETLHKERPLAAHPSRVRSMNMNVQEYIPYNQDQSHDSDSDSEDDEGPMTMLPEPTLLGESSSNEQSTLKEDIFSKDVKNRSCSDPEVQLTPKTKSVPTTSSLRNCPSPAKKQYLPSQSHTERPQKCQTNEIQNRNGRGARAVRRDRPLAAHPSRLWTRRMNIQEHKQEHFLDSDSEFKDEERQVTLLSQPTFLVESSTAIQEDGSTSKAVLRDRPLAAHPSRLRSRSMIQKCISYNQKQSDNNDSMSENDKKALTLSQPLLCERLTDKQTKMKNSNTEKIGHETKSKSIQVAQGPTTERISFHLTPKKDSVPANFPPRPSTAVGQFLLSSSRTSLPRKPHTRNLESFREGREPVFRERPQGAHHSRLRSRIKNVQEYIPYDQEHSDNSDSGSENEEPLTLLPQPLLDENSTDEQRKPQIGESSNGKQPRFEDIISPNCCEPKSQFLTTTQVQSQMMPTCTASSSNLTKAFSAFPLRPLGRDLRRLDDKNKHHTEETQNANEVRERSHAVTQSRSIHIVKVQDDITYRQSNGNEIVSDDKK